jgi:UDP-glucose:glycoprotein glucosyltransferase
VKDPAALFSTIPEDPLLTMGFEVPPAWVVVSKESIYDLDNIVLSKLSPSARETGIDAIYQLKNILIDGHARDISQNNARGVQIILGTEQNPHVVDTIVMANLGYLQLKANPGVWALDLKAGRSKEIFELQTVGSEGWTSRDVETIGADVVLTSFEGITIYPRLVRREGKDTEDVLEDDSQNVGFVNQAENFIGKWGSKLMGKTGKKVEKSGTKQADINIFSVASGHLYERFIYIMIQSVLKHTQSTVKFWFIENFLSPSFKVATTYSEV